MTKIICFSSLPATESESHMWLVVDFVTTGKIKNCDLAIRGLDTSSTG